MQYRINVVVSGQVVVAHLPWPFLHTDAEQDGLLFRDAITFGQKLELLSKMLQKSFGVRGFPDFLDAAFPNLTHPFASESQFVADVA